MWQFVESFFALLRLNFFVYLVALLIIGVKWFNVRAVPVHFTRRGCYIFVGDLLFSAFLAWLSYDFMVVVQFFSLDNSERVFGWALLLLAAKNIGLLGSLAISRLWVGSTGGSLN